MFITKDISSSFTYACFSTNIVRLMVDEVHNIIKFPGYRNANIFHTECNYVPLTL